MALACPWQISIVLKCLHYLPSYLFCAFAKQLETRRRNSMLSPYICLDNIALLGFQYRVFRNWWRTQLLLFLYRFIIVGTKVNNCDCSTSLLALTCLSLCVICWRRCRSLRRFRGHRLRPFGFRSSLSSWWCSLLTIVSTLSPRLRRCRLVRTLALAFTCFSFQKRKHLTHLHLVFTSLEVSPL